MNCEHGFVVRNILGINRFLCRECGERFSSYPKLGRQRFTSIVDKISPETINAALDPFKDEYVYAEGVTMSAPLTYTFPVMEKATIFPVRRVLGDENE